MPPFTLQSCQAALPFLRHARKGARMVEFGQETPAIEADAASVPRKRRWLWVLGLLLGLVALGLAALWLQREWLADRVIAGQLDDLGLAGTYKVESIGPTRQVLSNLVLGDPARPDLTIEQAVIEIEPQLGLPVISKITLLRPRLFGSYKAGKFSFGSLDKFLFTGSTEPFRLPALNVALVDGRARLDTDYGLIGIKAEGAGGLQNGFAGVLAATAPSLAADGCAGQGGTLYGTIRIASEQPVFSGPVRLERLSCAGLSLQDANVQITARFDPTLAGAEGKLALTTGAAQLQGRKLAALGGQGDYTFRKGDLTSSYRLSATGLSAELTAAGLGLEGGLRTRDGFARIEAEGELTGTNLQLGSVIDSALGQAEQASAGSLAAPLLAQTRASLRREAAGSKLAANYVLRQTGGVTSLVVPRAVLRGRSGADLLAVSRFDLIADGRGTPRFAGNFITGGPGLPRISGRMEQRGRGAALARIMMQPYSAGGATLALPQLMVAQARDGSLGFSGTAQLSGPLPGGAAKGLVLPLDGNWSGARGLSAWRGCVPVRFEQLTLANLTLERKALTLCPGPGGAILRSDARGTRFAAGAASLDLAGRLGTTPIRIASGPVGFAIPGALAAKRLDIALGPNAETASFRIEALTAQIGREIAGRFAGSDVQLKAVPLDIFAAEGAWRYADGRLSLSEGVFRLEDRQLDKRFQPLLARDATLTLEDNQIAAKAVLREPTSDREIVRVAIGHDLTDGRGFADLAVPGVVFDKQLQPVAITRLSLGVIANAEGVISGQGRIDWNPKAVTSTGRFRTDGIDFAAAFGPVKGISGVVEFTDLIGLVTAKDQRLDIASISPGIEVNDGKLSFQLEPDGVLQVNGAYWPFLDGRMELKPTRMVLGAAEVRRFTLDVEGVNAAKFVQRLELNNLSATGTFDGTLPLVFDENGGRIEGGMLRARAPGGNVSYVGELSYKDMGAMANFAFDALRSLDYQEMQIGLDGALEGEIVTRVQFRGVKQGAGTKRNFLTRRIAALPIQFNVNLRAPFFQLISSFKALYDPEYVRDPRGLGIMGPDGKPLSRLQAAAQQSAPPLSAPPPVTAPAGTPPIQPPVSEPMP